ncbi:Retrovirus-related Pol polyprotein from transposon RE1 [Vitis vinifera]|uniref:Retrovirus-related Pol polyprotein from transposon RE1 n=1 Tax=Vitis vinifera TaxID=29760 RepID=A0A438GZJ2_VITVI|nr:Retrovirus-related Pol polyprotein from transposon RE1 [Vitis vinifera]
MKLILDFEIARSNMLNRHPIPSLDACLSELLREKQRIVTQATMEHRANVSAPVSIAYAAQGRNKGRDMRVVQCFSCKDFGHIARDCPKNSTALPAASSVVPIPAPTALANPNTLAPEMDQVSGKMTAKGPKVGRLFPLHVSPFTIIPSFPLLSFACNVVGFGHKMWHRRLGHPNSDVLRTLFNSGLLGIKACSSLDLSFNFTSCKLGKGIAPIVSHAHYKYFVTFIDDFSRFTWVYFLWAKAEVFSVFKQFLALIETQFSANIKVLCSDFGREYMSNEFQDFLQSKWIISQSSCPSTPQQNGVAERKNRHLLDVAMEHKCWKNSMQAELQALEENHTWDIVTCPHTVKPIGSKWVFSVKLRSDGSLDRYKARLVALAIAASQSWQLHQMDVNNAFLHGDLQKEIYMKLPSGMTNSSPHDVCKLKRSLYGLKQAPRAWFEKFRSTILFFSFTQSQYDYSLFFHTSASAFHMKDLGQLTYFLGLEVHHWASGIFVNQHKYIQDLITLAGLEDTSYVDTPMEVNVKYRKDEGDLLDDPTLYRRLVGIRCIIRYLRGSPTRGLFFLTGFSLQLVAYNDADWGGCPDTRRSTTGWCMFLGDALISWRCKKQDRVSKSSTEVEYRAMSTACSEIVWLRDLLKELGFLHTTFTPLHANNTSAIQIATNPVFHERTKHIEVDCHSIRDTLESLVIYLPHISSDLQVADIFTKALTRQRHQFLVGKLLLVDLPSSI